MTFFATWWQAITFGVVATVGMLVVASLFHTMWEKYEDRPAGPSKAGCNAHHH